MSKQKVKKVVLAYSGGLDTSIILKWLQTEYGAEVVTFTADLGQGGELEPARKKAEMLGIKDIYIEDLREEFVRDFVFPMFRANAVYEGVYLLGTSIARPLIAKQLIEIAAETGADAIAHGATGKGNDQVRFELTAAALDRAQAGLDGQTTADFIAMDIRRPLPRHEFDDAVKLLVAKSRAQGFSQCLPYTGRHVESEFLLQRLAGPFDRHSSQFFAQDRLHRAVELQGFGQTHT